MSSKKDYDKEVKKTAKRIVAVDRIYSKTKRPASDTKRIATQITDQDIEKSVRGYVKGSINDPAVQRAADRTLAKARAKKRGK